LQSDMCAPARELARETRVLCKEDGARRQREREGGTHTHTHTQRERERERERDGWRVGESKKPRGEGAKG
jgi:hypothetical protein